MEQEIWVDVVGFEGEYKVSNLSRIKSFKYWRFSNERILIQNISKTGYRVVTLFKKNFSRVYKVHRLVAEAFLPNPENKRTVNHKDGDKLNNNLINLEWATDYENVIHAFRNGLIPKCLGERQSATILTEKKVLEIAKSKLTRRELEKIYNVHYNTIRGILTGENWGWLTGIEYKGKKRNRVYYKK